MSDEDTAQPLIRFVLRIAQEYEIETATLAEAYAELNRLVDRGDDRATWITGLGRMAPASMADTVRLSQGDSLSS